MQPTRMNGIHHLFSCIACLCVAAHVIAKAEGLAIISVIKAGFLVTARGGSGVVIARLADRRKTNFKISSSSSVSTIWLRFLEVLDNNPLLLFWSQMGSCYLSLVVRMFFCVAWLLIKCPRVACSTGYNRTACSHLMSHWCYLALAGDGIWQPSGR